ncbi:recombinase family protein [Alkaliphilus sp. B6464]|uniref:recombinase family protein n=1 Tax=Alkaliphilus sp. B6464 TaxID=2731219 RepID=UPI001BAB3B96|nr:recombinase family protein [Alkaliphilus sp. B6464]QUH21115.1 recombinase family protein [Alkaliphilus sp. B6464]
MNRAALYIRVSTSHQVDKDSLPFQRKELSNYAKYVLGIDNFEIFEDAGYSAKNTDRPKYQEMMSRIKNREFTHLLVWKIDRISRNLRDFSEMYDDLRDYGVTFVSKNEQFDTSSAMGEAMLKIILVFAELERKITAERVYSIMLSRAQKGQWNGATTPLGYKWSDEVKFPVIDEKESKTVKYIYDLYEDVASTSKVAFQLNSENVKTKRDGTWSAKTVGDVLRNPFYIGTYRYNMKNNKRRWKDEKDWIVVEDNHPGIIQKEQFEKVNKILADNYRGNRSYQRANEHTHICSRLLFCGKCGNILNAGLDSTRKDGYRPSRYTCSTNQKTDNINSCSNFISDITILPFVLNYIANFINLQGKITQRHSLRDIERILLRGNAFVDVDCVDRKGLEQTYTTFVLGFENNELFESDNGNSNVVSINFELDSLQKEKIKFEKALQRLEDLFLFSEEAMSQKDFLFKKRDIINNLDRINADLSELHRKNMNMKSMVDVSFLNNAKHFLIAQELSNKRYIDYRELVDIVGNDLIKDFIQTVVDKIVVLDKKVVSITFKNGITHNFLYKDLSEQKNIPREKFLYKSFEPIVLEYLQKHKSASRKELELLVGMSRSAVTSILDEFIDKDLIEKRGNSVATRYFIKQKDH